ncbi:hypothetical protein YB2330_005086 [Saitoella coloradoensis]
MPSEREGGGSTPKRLSLVGDGEHTPSPGPRPVTSHRHPLSHRDLDAPPMSVRWHYAVDQPKRKLYPSPTAPPKPATKYVPFSPSDSRALEAAFQRCCEVENDAQEPPADARMVMVNEDQLFEVDVVERELKPVYWNGPIYEVRRGTWFVQEGSALKPCDENLAVQVEEGYMKIKPFNFKKDKDKAKEDELLGLDKEKLAEKLKEAVEGVARLPGGLLRPEDAEEGGVSRSRSGSVTVSPGQKGGTPTKSKDAKDKEKEKSKETKEQVWPLLGTHMGKFVVYTNENTAWIFTKDIYSMISSTLFSALTAGVHKGGTKLVRGFTDAAKSRPPVSKEIEEVKSKATQETAEALRFEGGPQSEEARAQVLEAEMEEDYEVVENEDPTREIEHLVLCVHGIGQKLGERIESVNFVHDVNVMRRTMKTAYKESELLQTLNGEAPEKKEETGKDEKDKEKDKEKEKEDRVVNSKVQVLPVQWRQRIQFGLMPDEGEGKDGKESDLGMGEEGEEEEVATLQDITVEGVPSVRNLVSDVLLDILLYYQPIYRERILRAVHAELNRVYTLFKERNPEFKGKVSLVGHSLGSAILFDILTRQPGPNINLKHTQKLELTFDVEHFFAIGSPIGLFQMLRGKHIAARSKIDESSPPMPSPIGVEVEDPFAATEAAPMSISSPKCRNFYNIFHPSDPVAYRIEPLISKHAAKLKAHPLPWNKGGIRTQLVGLQKVAQGATSIFSGIRSSITKSIVNMSLGYGDLSAPAVNQPPTQPTTQAELLPGDEHNVTSATGDTLYSGFVRGSKTAEEKVRLSDGEKKLYALNGTGRIDFAIQEGMFEQSYSYISVIASHLQYWQDADVMHFILSQLLWEAKLAEKSNLGGKGSGVKNSK